MSRELETKEVELRIRQLEEERETWMSSTKDLFGELNECQACIAQRTRAHRALLGELEMFKSLLANANKKRNELERDIALRSNLSLNNTGQGVGVQRGEKSRAKLKQSEIPDVSSNTRPKAYIPTNNEDENIIMVPRPFGVQPFMPTQSGSTMKNR